MEASRVSISSVVTQLRKLNVSNVTYIHSMIKSQLIEKIVVWPLNQKLISTRECFANITSPKINYAQGRDSLFGQTKFGTITREKKFTAHNLLSEQEIYVKYVIVNIYSTFSSTHY